MLPHDPFQSQVTQIALAAAAEHGFALGGGQALIAHGTVHRPTEDIDLFTDSDGAVQSATSPVEASLSRAGLEVHQLADTEHRDFVDVAAALQRYNRDHLVALAKRSDPALTDDEVSEAMGTLDRLPDKVFQRWIDIEAVSELRAAFADWPR